MTNTTSIRHHKSIIISDVYLGTGGSKIKRLIHFLKINSCDRLIFNGDIVKNWQPEWHDGFNEKHFDFFSSLLSAVEHNNTEVVFVTGSQNIPESKVIPIRSKNVTMQKDFILTAGKMKYLVMNGVELEALRKKLSLSDRVRFEMNYLFFYMNKSLNKARNQNGLYYKSILKYAPSFNQTCDSFIPILEDEIFNLIKEKNCDGIICGHIHKPCIIQKGNYSYMNTGYWTESTTALTESHKGIWSLYNYAQSIEEIKQAKTHFKIQQKAFSPEIKQSSQG